ncbi:MAG: glycine cleavage system protein H [Chloroflexi bacterium]|nr:glycine cleavage system protein H [Chloroflexota bacterium]
MTTIDKWEFPDELYYTEDHNWVRVEGDVVTLGMTQFGQDLAGEIVYVELPRAGRQVAPGEPFMSMESGKWVGRIKSPLAGTITEGNADLEFETTAVNQDPYGQGWLAKIRPTDPAAVKGLLRADSPEFAALIAAERVKYNK